LTESGATIMPMVDPGLYMARFADKLDFGADTGRIVQHANRVAQRMSRDWISTGRRPSGICAASLYIAARLNNYNRTIREIVMVVKICEGTLRQRLQEFSKTPSGQLSTTDFQTIMLDTAENPPSFNTTQKRKHDSNLKQIEAAEQVEDDDLGEDELLEEATKFVNDIQSTSDIASNVEENLSDLDSDPEIANCLAMSDDEQEFKNELWLAENGDWLQKQAANGPKVAAARKEPRKVLIID
jgi:transcription factor IIIB 90 kDa subunit